MGTIDRHTTSDLNLKRFMGKWYEIARFDHRFEKGLEGVTAEYSFREDGKIKVVNCGYKYTLSGKKKCSIGKAKLPKSGQSGQLKVSFFLFFYSDYNILELDSDYQWVLVGSATDKYLWILSRSPQLPVNTLKEIIQKAKSRGYNTSKLLFPQQPKLKG